MILRVRVYQNAPEKEVECKYWELTDTNCLKVYDENMKAFAVFRYWSTMEVLDYAPRRSVQS